MMDSHQIETGDQFKYNNMCCQLLKNSTTKMIVLVYCFYFGTMLEI